MRCANKERKGFIMKNRNWFWGIIFLLCAVVVIASQTGAFAGIGIISIVAGVLILALVVQSLVQLNFFGVFLPLAVAYIVFKAPLGLPEISIPIIILASVFASIGFSILFRSHPKQKYDWHQGREHFAQTTETMDDNNPYAKVNFGSSSKYLHSDSLKGGQFSASFGELEVFFDKAQLSPDGAEIFLDCSFGSIKLYIPKQWQVLDNLSVNLGEVTNKVRTAQPDENSPKLTLTGNVQFGGIEIEYI